MTKSHSKLDKRYRLGVGMMLVNSENQVFVGQRIDKLSDAWQMPQGGIDKHESPYEAALRELEEEIGTHDVLHVAETKEWLTYDLPEELVPTFWDGKYIGQQQKWFLLKIIDESAININTHEPEFISWKWVDPESLVALAVPFKKELYVRVLYEFYNYLYPTL